jgi:hypothetical protein
MTSIVAELKKNKIKHSLFFEEDLNDALTGIALLADSRVFDRKNYPGPFDKDPNPVLMKIEKVEPSLRSDLFTNKAERQTYKAWLKSIGGRQNEFLRYYLPMFKLASN